MGNLAKDCLMCSGPPAPDDEIEGLYEADWSSVAVKDPDDEYVMQVVGMGYLVDPVNECGVQPSKEFEGEKLLDPVDGYVLQPCKHGQATSEYDKGVVQEATREYDMGVVQEPTREYDKGVLHDRGRYVTVAGAGQPMIGAFA